MEAKTFKYNPLVTIIIPVYNGGQFLRYAIDSALEQDYENKEILVISDGSTDDSDEIAKGYGDKIRFIRKENGGVSSVLNMAIAEMKGSWLSWLSHDDTYATDKISSQIALINELIEKEDGKDAEKYVICCANDRIDANGNTVKRKIKYGRNFDNPNDMLISQIGNYTIGGCCVLASRSAYIKEGGFNEKNRTCSDDEMWYKLILDGYKFVFLKKVSVHSRQHKGMVSVTKRELCISEGEELHGKVFDAACEKGFTEKEVYRLLCALSARGYGKVAKTKLKKSKITFAHRAVFAINNFFCNVKKLIIDCLRKIYRKIKY